MSTHPSYTREHLSEVTMRGLNTQFLGDLRSGRLAPILERVQLDQTLCIELRDDYLNVYYRGGNLLKLQAVCAGYRAHFDLKYAKPGKLTLPSALVLSLEDAERWVDTFPRIKLAMDLWLSRNAKEEREVQQVIVRDNNVGGVSRKTDFYICDIEYTTTYGSRFDLVAVHWPSTSGVRRTATGRRLVLGEVKFGDGAMCGKAGLHDHVRDANLFLSDAGNVAKLKVEMVDLFNQKRAMGLMNSGRELESFSDEKPLFLLILVNHDPEVVALGALLRTLPPAEHLEVRVVASSLMGYGIFDPCVLTIEQVFSRHGEGI